MRQIPLEDFFRNSPRTAFQLSPDGSHIAYLAPYENRMNLFVRPMRRDDGGADARDMQLTFETTRSIAGYFWADNCRLLFMKDTGGDENYQLYGVNLDGTDLRAYTPFPGVRTSIIDDLEEVDGEILIGMNRRNPEVFDPYRLNLRTGELTPLAENPGNWQGWMTDHDGCLRSVTAIVDGVNTQILYRDHDGEPFRPVLTTNFRESVDFMEFTPDNRLVWAATNIGRDKMVLVLMDPATCKELEVLYENPRYDVNAISYSRRRKRLLGVFCTGHRDTVRHYFDDEEAALRKRLEAHFPGKRFGMADVDKAEENYLYYVGGDRTRGAYYYYNIHEDAPRLIARLAPWLDEEQLVPMQAFTYTSRDGLEIEAYLSTPQGGEDSEEGGGRFPLVVIPHGGPWARDRWGYNSEVQFLCNRGYAVLQMNFRGSTGYGRRFLEASYKEWGRKMQDDITDGVEYLIRQGIANPQRVAIYGGSYGGYAALAGLCFTPDLYRCGVDYCGVSNLFTFMQTIPPYWKPLLEMMYEQVGNPDQDREMLAAASPALHADRIRVPLFIAQGANDPRVNKVESDQMVEALRRNGVEVEYMVKDNEGHGFANEENRFDFYRRMEAFLAKYL
ncbi:MAG: S9 family peptidase [Alloprevotella sp.]|nr:S9 family peptidase [Alloprevotella sp.]